MTVDSKWHTKPWWPLDGFKPWEEPKTNAECQRMDDDYELNEARRHEAVMKDRDRLLWLRDAPVHGPTKPIPTRFCECCGREYERQCCL